MICNSCKKDKDLSNFEFRSEGRYRKQCKDCVKKRRHNYYCTNKDSIKCKTKLYAKNNKEKNDEYKKQWVKKNLEKRREINRNSEFRRRTAKNKGNFDYFSIEDIINIYGNKCFYCGGNFEHVDHFVPLSKGGDHSLENVRPSCAKCNLSKGSKMFYEFIGEDT